MRHLLLGGHTPIVAGNEAQLSFIRQAFPGIRTTHLKGYDITYSRWNQAAQAGLLLQLPGILDTIRREHQWLQHAVKEWDIHGIISDNRYGLYHDAIPSVIMTHQLRIRSGIGNVADNILQRIHYRHLDRFTATWVVDAENEPALAGTLSHPAKLPRHHRYIGLLSRLGGVSFAGEGDALLILLSGPEPQRSQLSHMLWEQAVRHTGNVIFVEGTKDADAPADIPTHIQYHSRIESDELAGLLERAGMVICRSGYSTLMDLVATGKKAILIPTPGQTEQQYLGKYLQEQGTFYAMPQDKFMLEKALNEARAFPYRTFTKSTAFGQHRQVIDNWLLTL